MHEVELAQVERRIEADEYGDDIVQRALDSDRADDLRAKIADPHFEMPEPRTLSNAELDELFGIDSGTANVDDGIPFSPATTSTCGSNLSEYVEVPF